MKPVTNLNVTQNVAMITLDNVPNKIDLIASIFNEVASHGINIDMISQTAPYKGNINLSFSLDEENVPKAISALSKFKKEIPHLRIDIISNLTKLSIYGEAMRDLPGVAASLFTTLAEAGVELKMVTTSEVDISYLIDQKDEEKAVEIIKQRFGLE
ncbi:ACT domain-containing protein [Caldicellulosiruptor changbaiensis]|uniref:aspartate kinase n=1 Tax=Caldicellulosiruptor changbaiensis TaxID=1222016 RepID=A0A3T0D6H8_9FIRM|nr:ACT domain-containing protein [Caldicellulosiruptor changbaiensis]AZT90685.1 ACT domain-containing protein [Caldicellulosiruptor changbaiensis]